MPFSPKAQELQICLCKSIVQDVLLLLLLVQLQLLNLLHKEKKQEKLFNLIYNLISNVDKQIIG